VIAALGCSSAALVTSLCQSLQGKKKDRETGKGLADLAEA
jgi:hypothetical protein